MALSWLNCHTWPIVYIFVVCLPIYCHAAPYSYNSSSHAFPGMPVQAPQAGLGRSVIIPDQMINVGDDVSRIFRRDSEDPSCPDGFLCVQQACPAEIICEAGESCFNFEGTIACGDPGLQWCAFNPSTLEAVGCNGGQCW
jgi:hypothetical protein